ncbi:MAG: HAMP domain-containing histidine kinase [Gemmatimonadales bacterium]|nr:HAMP domain-containing histidine kinase [Gemmatimonadales bacterium]
MNRTTLPIVVLVLAVAALGWVQFRWLAELRTAARDRMGRDLRVGVQAAVTEIGLDLVRLAAAMERAGPDSAARAAAWAEWRGTAAEAGDLFRGMSLRADTSSGPPTPFEIDVVRIPAGWIVFAIDSARLVDSLFPRLARRIERAAELDIALSLVYRSAHRQTWTAARIGDPKTAPPDVASPILTEGGHLRLPFIGLPPSPSAPRGAVFTPDIDWSTSSSETGLPAGSEGPGWQLQAWHGAGSLERAARQGQYRNLAIAFGLIALLATAGGTILTTLRRNARLAEDRAAILAGISHEVRTPLAVLRSAAENLASGVLRHPSDMLEYGRLMEMEAAKLERTIEGALAFARAADSRTAARESVDLVDLAREVVAAMEGGHRLTIEATGSPRVSVNRSAIGIAIRNLIDNALGYSPPTEMVTVRIWSDGSRAHLAVIDRGPGVPQAEHAQIFEPFFRGTTAAAVRRSGLGLGLALAQRVATIHRGRLWLEPRREGGAVFHLELPIA